MSAIQKALQIVCVVILGHVFSGETCTLKVTEMQILRHVTMTYRGSLRDVECRGGVTINKCEGECASMSIPSAKSDTGIERTCKCCREDGQRSKEVILLNCYEGEQRLFGIRPITTSVTEPIGCSCQECKN